MYFNFNFVKLKKEKCKSAGGTVHKFNEMTRPLKIKLINRSC